MAVRTWTLNISEMVRLVHEANLVGVFKPVTTDDAVGHIGICTTDFKRKKHPMQWDTLGRIEFVSPEDEYVELMVEEGGDEDEHVDGEEGEVYVMDYNKRKKIDADDLACL